MAANSNPFAGLFGAQQASSQASTNPFVNLFGVDDDETRFRSWYAERARRLDLNPNPDDPQHRYDYRAAYKAGVEPDDTGHWPSEFKSPDHPNRYVDGIDTITGEPVDTKANARRLREERARELREGGALSTDDAIERERRPSDYVDRLGTAILSNLSGPVDLVGALTDRLAQAPAVAAMMPGGQSNVAALGAAVNAARTGLAGAESATGLPFTSASQQRHRERFRELSTSLPPVADALVDTGIEGAGAFIDPAAAGLSALKVLKPARRVASAVLHEVAPGNRVAVTIGGKTIEAPHAGDPLPGEPAAPRFTVVERPDRTFQGEPLAIDPGKAPEQYRTIVTVDSTTGRDVHALLVEQTPTGFKAKNSFTDPEYRGQHVGDNSYAYAQQTLGPYEGPTDYLGRQTEAGAAAVASMQRRGVLSPPPTPPKPGLGEAINAADQPPMPNVPRISDAAPTQFAHLSPPPPSTVIAPIVTPPFQTNLAAQVGGREVADYIIQRSDEIAKAIGSPQGWDEVEELALRTNRTKEQFLAQSPQFAKMSKEERARLTMVIKGNESDITSLQSKLVDNLATDEDKAHLVHLIDQRGSLIKLAVGVGSEYGRALNSLKMEARAALGEVPLARQALYRKYRETVDQHEHLIAALSRLDPTNPDELQQFLRAVDQPRFRDYVQEYWVGSVLSGPATQERNLIGNVANAITENFAVRPVRAVLDPVIAKVQGRAREHYMREVPAAAVGMTHGIRKGLARGLEVLKRGYDVNGTGKLLPVRSAFARSQNKLVREVVGPVATGSLRLLSAADTVFKTLNYTADIYAQAANTAAREGLSGEAFATRVAQLADSPTGAMIDAADNFALKATFNDPASNIGKAWMKLRDAVPGGQFLSPFVKIADRLMARGFEYTPVGFAKAARATKGTADVTDLAARGAIGSAIMLAGASLAVDDRLTAAAPDDPAERDAFYRAGKKPWAVKVDDAWIPYGQLQPVATPLALVASAMQAWRTTGEVPPSERISDMATQVGQYVTDQSYMDSVGKFFSALSGGHGAAKALTDLAAQTAGGFVPLAGLTRSIAQAMDPRVMDTRTVPDKLLAQVPGGSRSLTPRLDAWGEDITPTAGKLRGVLASGTPLDASREEVNPLDAELQNLGMPLGTVGKSIYDPRQRMNVKLSQNDYYYYQQTAGRRTRELLSQLFADPNYQVLDAEQRRTAVEDVIGTSREYARWQLRARTYGWDIGLQGGGGGG